MSELPKISVIIPIYNMEKYLVSCLDSVKKQSYTNLEVLLINDGSTDRSQEICQAYVEQDSRFILINKENGGVSSARNLGIERSTSDYIAFIDPDDWINEDYIEFLYDKLVKYDADISICGYYNYNENDSTFHFLILEDDYYEKVFDRQEFFKDYHNSRFGRPFAFSTSWGKIIKKSLFDDLRYPIGRAIEDGFLTFKLYLKAKKIVYSNTGLLGYRVRDNSLARTINQQYILDFVDFMEEKITIMTYLGYDVSEDKKIYYNMLEASVHNGRVAGLENTEVFKQILEKLNLINFLKNQDNN